MLIKVFKSFKLKVKFNDIMKKTVNSVRHYRNRLASGPTKLWYLDLRTFITPDQIVYITFDRKSENSETKSIHKYLSWLVLNS